MVWTVYCIGQNKSRRRGGGKEGNEKSDGDKKKIDNYKKKQPVNANFHIHIYVLSCLLCCCLKDLCIELSC